MQKSVSAYKTDWFQKHVDRRVTTCERHQEVLNEHCICCSNPHCHLMGALQLVPEEEEEEEDGGEDEDDGEDEEEQEQEEEKERGGGVKEDEEEEEEGEAQEEQDEKNTKTKMTQKKTANKREDTMKRQKHIPR